MCTGTWEYLRNGRAERGSDPYPERMRRVAAALTFAVTACTGFATLAAVSPAGAELQPRAAAEHTAAARVGVVPHVPHARSMVSAMRRPALGASAIALLVFATW